tara:strand:+ start:4379 stop:5695 length:1317 start_codon:yes stop_codon:yes gene_type:complete
MATTIQIKRSTGSAAPGTSDLVEGELAYAEDRTGDGASAKLYISSIDSGGSEVIQEVGGKYYTDLLDNATNANTASAIVKRDASGNFNGGTITYGSLSDGTITVTQFVDEDNMASDSATMVPTQQSVKAYVDSQVTAIDVDVAGDSGTGAITDSETFTIAGGTGITTAMSGNTLTATLDDTAVTAGSYGSTTAVPILTIDAQGRITAASTGSIATSFDIAADSGSNDTVAGGETLTFAGTANEIETTVSNNQIQIGLPNNVTIGGNATISGNLTVSGTTTTVDSTTLSVADPLIILASGNNSSDALDIGLYGLYDTSGSQDLYAGFFRDASDSGKWKLFKDLQAAPTTTVNTSGTGYAVGTLVANIEGNVSGGTVSGLSADIAVADGGTGAGSFTSNGIIFGNGTNALQVTAAGTEGQVLQAGSGGTPEFGGIDGGTY